ncbi:protein FANTASTIC FOUR 3-like [Chenopodium quinoa]|uniref:protein FANTASTIC FOUR 3-like n=1 Tax=Chenopodium quinoa TaxID=63459 RepID=UPI000B7861E9|nr:protein FANTASTIC FOUR 3-like [Chenopodium quinoa]
MSTIVYQELQPCCNNESHFIESRTTLSLKLNSSTKNSVENFSSNSLYGAKTTPSSSNSSGGWSSIEALTSKRDAVPKEEVVYVHPLVKRSSFMLSEKSLKMCTESLGNETGTFDMESTDSLFTSTTTTTTKTKITTTATKGRTTPRQKFDIRKELSLGQGKFPPPLTTIAGTSNICVRPYREDGRLVIEAVSTPPIQACMQAERSDGRLRLSMMMEDINDNDNDNDNENDNGVEELVENDEEGLEEEVVKEEVLEECNKKNDAYLLEDMNGISKELGVKLGIGKIQRTSRCKERGQGNKGLINWEPFWVAT